MSASSTNDRVQRGKQRFASQTPLARTPFRPAVVLALVGAALVVSGGCLLRDSAFDFPVTAAAFAHNAGVAGVLAAGLYAALKPIPAIVITFALVALCTWLTGPRRAVAFGTTVAIVWLPVWIIKIVFDRPRPATGVVASSLSDPSYPSGHTAFVATSVVALALLTAGWTLTYRVIIWVVGALLIVAIAASVLILGIHFPTDVAASVVWAGSLTPLVWRCTTAWFRAA